MAAVIIPQEQLRIPEHLRSRLDGPALRLVGTPRGRPANPAGLQALSGADLARTATAGRVATGEPQRAVQQATRAPATLARRGRVAPLLVAACLAVVALTGVTALAAGRPAPAPGPAEVPAAVAVPPAGVWVVQPGDSLWSIAAAVAPGADLRPIVDELASRAGGDGLQPGQRISLDGLVP